jgi:hypothetical protein
MGEGAYVFESNMEEFKHHKTKVLKKPKILIYGVGQYGVAVAKIALKKGWPIVGAVNRAGEKIGQDLGKILGLDMELDITIQDCELADYLSMKADIGIVAISDYLKDTLPAYKHLLNAGINVICHGAQASFPQGVSSEIAEKIDILAKKNKVTFTGTSLWDMTRVGAGLLVTGPCTDINALSHKSITDVSQGGLHAMDFCGVGLTEDEFAATLHTELRLLLPHEKEYVEWTVDGMPNCSIRVDRQNSVYHSASTLFNRIPDVVSAMPGLRLCSDLGPMQHTALIPNLR